MKATKFPIRALIHVKSPSAGPKTNKCHVHCMLAPNSTLKTRELLVFQPQMRPFLLRNMHMPTEEIAGFKLFYSLSSGHVCFAKMTWPSGRTVLLSVCCVYLLALPLVKAITPSQIVWLSKPKNKHYTISAQMVCQTSLKKKIKIQKLLNHYPFQVHDLALIF